MISQMEQKGDFTFVTVSDTGMAHRLKNIPNQDSAGYFLVNEDFFLAVSDGVGSCRKADVGAETAIAAMKKIFLRVKNGALRPELSMIVAQMIAEWKKMISDENIDDYCTTLKAAIKFGNKILLFSIGDGLVAVTSNGMNVCSPWEDALFVNQTRCLNGEVEAADFWTAEFVLDTYVSYVIFACTDGVANGIKDGQELELVQELEKNIDAEHLKDDLEAFIVNLSEYSSDDRTVGVVKYERKDAESDW